jgi:hypothetical protein
LPVFTDSENFCVSLIDSCCDLTLDFEPSFRWRTTRLLCSWSYPCSDTCQLIVWCGCVFMIFFHLVCPSLLMTSRCNCFCVCSVHSYQPCLYF